MPKRIEKDAAEIMIILLIYREDFISRPRNKENLSEWSMIPVERVVDASVYLCSNGFTSMRGTIIEPTEEGLQWVRGMSINPHFMISIRAWKEEVLIGMTSGGNQTKIENAVLQKKERYGGHVNKVEDRLISQINLSSRDPMIETVKYAAVKRMEPVKVSKKTILKIRDAQ